MFFVDLVVDGQFDVQLTQARRKKKELTCHESRDRFT